MINRCVFTSAVAAACCLLMHGCGNNSQQNVQHNDYKAITIKTGQVSLSESYPATIKGRQDISVYPQVSGTISKVCVKEGQKVRKGQSLFVIDQVPFKAALQMAQANVEAAEASEATARLVYESRKSLYENDVISEFDLNTSYNSLLTAKAQLAQAKAQKVTAENNMNYTMVLSQADGVVGTLPYREGALVSPQIPAPLTTVSDNSEMYVYFSVTENKLLDMTYEHGSMTQALDAMPQVSLMLSNGMIYKEKGRIETISGVIDPNTGSVSVRAVFPNTGGILLSGASGKVIIEKEIENAIVIPCSATFEMQDIVFAYMVKNGKAKAIRLEVNLTDDGRSYIVTEGLSAGDVIIAEGVGMLRDGQEVSVKIADDSIK